MSLRNKSRKYRQLLWELQTGVCAGKYPGCPVILQPEYTQLDHCIPLAVGGSCDHTNCQLLCANCHAQKSISEQRRIMEHRKLALVRAPEKVCWACSKTVSRWFWNGGVCSVCMLLYANDKSFDPLEAAMRKMTV